MPIIKTYSEDFKFNKISEYLESNLSMGDFCIKNQIKLNTFRAWYYGYLKLRKSWDVINEKSDDPIEVILNVAKEFIEEHQDKLFHSRIVIMKINDA